MCFFVCFAAQLRKSEGSAFYSGWMSVYQDSAWLHEVLFNRPVCFTESLILLLLSVTATGLWVAVTIFVVSSLQSAPLPLDHPPLYSPLALTKAYCSFSLSLSAAQLTVDWRLRQRRKPWVFIETLSFTRTIITLPHTEKTGTSKLSFGFASLQPCACNQCIKAWSVTTQK